MVDATLATRQRTVATVACYDRATRIVEIASQIAVWHRLGKPAVTIRGVLIRDPQALLCADPAVDPTQILEWFAPRWQLEVTFQEARTDLGLETKSR